jgi:excisionase family DNA binding protein
MVEKEWLTPSDAIKYLGISRQKLYDLMDEGILPYYTLKGVRKRRIKKTDLDALFEKGNPHKKKTAR